MSVLTTIDGIPLYTTVAEALAWAVQNGTSGYHTHDYQGQTGYMGGTTHPSPNPTNSGNMNNNNNSGNLPPARSSSGGNGAGGGSY